jgi:bacterial/archaeal transporter family protein
MRAVTVLLLPILTILLWGLWGFLGKLAMNRAMPASSVFLAGGVVGGVAVALLLFQFHRTGGAMPWQAPFNIWGVLAGACLAIGSLFFYLALGAGQAVIVVPLTASYPVITVLLSMAFLGERPSPAQWIGLALVVAGALLLLSGVASGVASPSSRP